MTHDWNRAIEEFEDQAGAMERYLEHPIFEVRKDILSRFAVAYRS